MASLRDRRWPLREVFGTDGDGFAAAAIAHEQDTDAIAVIESFLRSFRPAFTPSMELAGRITARIAEDRSIVKVEQIVDAFATDARQLQRLFREYVGVTPKWVIQRYRLIEAAERLAAGPDIGFADLALDLGYADQAHFIRDFRKIVGRPPADYARNLEPAPR